LSKYDDSVLIFGLNYPLNTFCHLLKPRAITQVAYITTMSEYFIGYILICLLQSITNDFSLSEHDN